MGEAKRKQYSRKQFLADHPRCIYCGEPATTTDHCPPRCFFRDRIWPETFEFAACEDCNSAARYDEQAFAALILLHKPSDYPEVDRRLAGLRNNHRTLVAEWMRGTTVARRRLVRHAFGPLGRDLWRAGWSAFEAGPATSALFDRFGLRLARALYYRHFNEVFAGVVYLRTINALTLGQDEGMLGTILTSTPSVVRPGRAGIDLTDQFMYRFQTLGQRGGLVAAVRFSDQVMFHMMVLQSDLAAQLEKEAVDNGLNLSGAFRFECP